MSTKRVEVVSDHFEVYGGERVERGQVIELRNQLNDDKLLGWNYVRELEPGEVTYQHSCGRVFAGDVTGAAVRAHQLRWRGDCAPPIDLSGPTIKRPKRGQQIDEESGAPGDVLGSQRGAGGKEVVRRMDIGEAAAAVRGMTRTMGDED